MNYITLSTMSRFLFAIFDTHVMHATPWSTRNMQKISTAKTENHNEWIRYDESCKKDSHKAYLCRSSSCVSLSTRVWHRKVWKVIEAWDEEKETLTSLFKYQHLISITFSQCTETDPRRMSPQTFRQHGKMKTS